MQRKTSPLHEAAYYGHVNVMKILLDHGANQYALDKVHTQPQVKLSAAALYYTKLHTLVGTRR